ncbi:MAG: PGPGW domain-containing protein [Kocuria sp.]|uniref:PGPGW domain-containing protein n=1 Tax=Kocuria salsicia TaxID=664639 RepID=A0ABV3KDW2_9MICC|nr:MULTISPECIES: PGPGW domain-containing protein [Kocuria]MBS6029401.1 PGPGW domain-containing protein [Kocuria rhizophila]MDO4255588.1 PGPGW domain-containing protein [Kocuria sp.]
MSSGLHEEIERGEQGGLVHQFVLRMRVASDRHPALRVLHKATVIVLGTVFVLAGIVMLVTPGPGWLSIFLGIGIWGTEFEWAHRLNLRIKRAALRVWRWWTNLVAERRYRRARDRPRTQKQGPRHLRAETPEAS